VQRHPVIALLTDFGEDDFFVASLKGVIVSINPEARVIDITHRIPSYEISVGSFILRAVYKYFPEKTIFLVIVDPGVGSSRRILLMKSKKHYFIAPDNGVLSGVLVQEQDVAIREITNTKYFLSDTSRTFEGRDKMAPAASWLSLDIPIEEFGPKTIQVKRAVEYETEFDGNEISGRILYEDKFGNLITNLSGDIVEEFLSKSKDNRFIIRAGNTEVLSFLSSYSDVEKGNFLCLIGSLGLLEIAVREGSAAKKLKMKTGDKIIIRRKV